LLSVCQDHVHRVSKTSRLWLAMSLTHVNGFRHFLAQILPIKQALHCNQKTLYYATSNNLCFCTTWQNGKTQKKLHFSLKCCINALPEFNQLLDVFSLFDSRLVLTLLYDSLSLEINAFSYRDCWGHGSGKRKLIALQQLDCVTRTMHQCSVFWVSYFAR